VVGSVVVPLVAAQRVDVRLVPPAVGRLAVERFALEAEVPGLGLRQRRADVLVPGLPPWLPIWLPVLFVPFLVSGGGSAGFLCVSRQGKSRRLGLWSSHGVVLAL
jgi:hypothetical protein